MAKFVIKASEFKNVCKAVNDRKLAELKNEIIEILKKQEEREVKKAVEFFEAQEAHYTHLEKSTLSGKWVEKAGYGVGTVRVWKGKKYKKIAPGKWARMYEKEGRGTNIAIGKLIAKVQNIDNVEDLMAFVQANKQRFVDENGMDLPVLDKLRAAVDARNDNVGSKGTSKPAEKKDTFEEEMNRLNDAQEAAWEGFESGSEIKATPENSKKFYDKVKKFVDENNIKLTKKHHDEIEEMNGHSFNEALALAGAYGEEEKKKALEWNKETNKKYKGAALDLSQIDEFKESEESEAEKHQNRSDAMKGNKNAYKGGLARDTVKLVKEVKGEPYHDFETDTNKLAIYSDDGRRSSGIVMSQEIADIIDSHNEPSILDWKDNIADEINAKYPAIQKDYVRLALGGIRPGYRSGKKENVKVVSSDESKNVEETAKETEPKVEPKKTSAYKAGKPTTSDPEKLKPIAKSENVGEGKVKLPYSKEVSEEIKALTNSVGKDQGRYSSHDFLRKVYYDKGNLVATDGRCMKVVKVGELEGIDNGSYVDIDNSKDGITITANKEFSKEHKFPLYERVIPKDNNEKIVLDNKALLAKIKDLKKDGSLTNKDPWVTFDIQGNDLMLDGVKVGDVSAANFKGDDSNYFNIDANYLANYVSGDYSELMSSQNNENPMYIGNDSAINIIQPQTKYEYKRDSDGNEKRELRRKDYDRLRESKKMDDEAKANKKAALKVSNQEYVDDIVNGYKRSVPADFEERSIKKMQDWSVEALERMYKVANADVDSLMDKKDFNSNNFSSYTNKVYNMSPANVIGQNYAMKEHPAIVRELEKLLKERGSDVMKSIFSDFLIESFIDEEEEDEEEESLWNDYSAEQPELFNSTELMVREALNRRRCL